MSTADALMGRIVCDQPGDQEVMSDYADGIWLCLYCKFWDHQDIHHGDCRRYPPTYVDHIEMRRYWIDSDEDATVPTSHWPRVASYDWCGEFKRCDRQEAICRLELIVLEEDGREYPEPLRRKIELREIREEAKEQP